MSVQLTKQLAAQLGEVAPVPFAQIRRIIELAGAETAQALADDAVTSAAGDGMLTPDGKPRTVGGIVFHLARQRLPPEVVAEIWMTWARRTQLQRARAGLPPRRPKLPRRLPPAQRCRRSAGRTRPRVVAQQDCVITMMTQMDKTFPPRVPSPLATPTGVLDRISARLV